MDAPTIQPKFLANGTDIGLVAVGFSGGQVQHGTRADNMTNANTAVVQAGC